jgi:protein gp37
VKADPRWRSDLWHLIETTNRIGGLEWLILTKRPENIGIMTPPIIHKLDSVRIGITAENQKMYDVRQHILKLDWFGKNFISVEPMLGPIELDPILSTDWVIAGCESGDNARECNAQWVYDLKNECKDKNIPFFLKQLRIDGRLVVTPMLNGQRYLEFPER